MKDVDILIFGTARSGKTTLSRMLAERFHYPIIHNDAIRSAFRKVYSLPPDPANSSVIEQNGYALFAHHFLRDNKSMDRFSTRYILEGDISALHARRFFHPEKNIIYFLGMAELTDEEIFEIVRETETPEDWTFSFSDKELLEKLIFYSSRNRTNKALCAQYGIPFIETSGDRQAILASLADEIAARIERIDSEDGDPDTP